MKGYPYTPKEETTAERLGEAGLPMWFLYQKSRKPFVVDVRTAVVACLFLYSSMTYEEIADIFGFSTNALFNMVKRHERLKDTDKVYKKKLDQVWKILEKGKFCKKDMVNGK